MSEKTQTPKKAGPAPPPNWRRRGKLLLGIITIAALIYIGGGLGDLAGAFSRFDPLWILLAFLVFLLNRLVMTWKWWQLLRLRNSAVGFFRAHCIYQACSLWGLFMPATVGADALRVYCLQREGVPPGESLASIVMERAIGLLSVLLFLAIAAAAVSRLDLLPDAWRNLFGLAAFGAGGVVLAFWLSLLPSIPERIAAPLLRRWPNNRPITALLKLHTAYRAYSRPPHRVATLFVFSFVEIMLTVAFFAVLLSGLGHIVPLDYLALATTGSFLLSRLPVTPGGLGVFEASIIGALTLVGVPVVDSLAVALVGRVLQIVSWLPWWAAYMITTGPPEQSNELSSTSCRVDAK